MLARKRQDIQFGCGLLPLVCLCLFCLFFLSSREVAAKTKAPTDEFGGITVMKPSSGKWKITAAKITYHQARKVYEAQGNVVISSEDRLMQADWAELDTENQQVELQGNVFLKYGQDWLWGETVFWNLDDQTGWVNGGMAYFAQNHFYVHGDYIAKTGPSVYELRSGFVTSCDPTHPDWNIRYKTMKINVGGTAWVTHSSLWVRDFLPVFYVPAAAMPIKRGRQSGFLIPWGGSSSLNGLEGEVPFYWAMREDMDATFYGRYMEKRGWMSGAEFRIDNNTWGKGIWLINYLNDQADKAHLQEQGYPFQTEDRYWLRARHVVNLPYQIKGFLDLDYASDSNLLNEFGKGSISYDFSNKLFRDFMGRGILNDKTILVRESSLYLEQPRESSLLSLDMRYWQQLSSTPESTTLQKVPSLNFDVIPSWINGSPFYYTLASSWVNYYRETGDHGSRLNVQPKIYYPMHWKSYLDVEPSVGLHTSAYSVDWEGDSSDQWQGSLFSEASLALSSRLNRVYALKMGDYVGIEHAIRPEVVYEYVPEISRGKIPLFDRLDQNQARHDVRYGFTSFLTTKEILKAPNGGPTAVYREIARLKLFQAFNIEPMQQVFFDSRYNSETEEGFSDVNMRLDLMPKRYLTLTYDTALATDQADATRQSVYLVLDSGKGQSLNLGYQFRENTDIDEIIAQVNLKVLPNVYLSSYYDYALKLDELFSQGYGVTYQHGCWALGLSYEKENQVDRVTVTVNLLGLGALGYNVGSEGSGPVMKGTGVESVKTW